MAMAIAENLPFGANRQPEWTARVDVSPRCGFLFSPPWQVEAEVGYGDRNLGPGERSAARRQTRRNETETSSARPLVRHCQTHSNFLKMTFESAAFVAANASMLAMRLLFPST